MKSVFLNSQGERTYGQLPVVAQKRCPAMPMLRKGIGFLLSFFLPNGLSSQITLLVFLSNLMAGRRALEERALELTLLPAMLHVESKDLTQDLPKSLVTLR